MALWICLTKHEFKTVSVIKDASCLFTWYFSVPLLQGYWQSTVNESRIFRLFHIHNDQYILCTSGDFMEFVFVKVKYWWNITVSSFYGTRVLCQLLSAAAGRQWTLQTVDSHITFRERVYVFISVCSSACLQAALLKQLWMILRRMKRIDWNESDLCINYTAVILCITACAVATSCCISDEPCQWEMANFDPPQLRNFLTDRSKTQTQETRPGGHQTCKIWCRSE